MSEKIFMKKEEVEDITKRLVELEKQNQKYKDVLSNCHDCFRQLLLYPNNTINDLYMETIYDEVHDLLDK